MKNKYKTIVIKLIKGETISESDFNYFLVEYVKIKKKKEISQKELISIKKLIKMGMFNLDFTINEAARDLNIYPIYISKDGYIFRIIV